jgi:hypothetical protein
MTIVFSRLTVSSAFKLRGTCNDFAVGALATRLTAAHAGAAPLMRAVTPATLSLRSVTETGARNNRYLEAISRGVEGQSRHGAEMGESGTSHAGGDEAAATSFFRAGW